MAQFISRRAAAASPVATAVTTGQSRYWYRPLLPSFTEALDQRPAWRWSAVGRSGVPWADSVVVFVSCRPPIQWRSSEAILGTLSAYYLVTRWYLNWSDLCLTFVQGRPVRVMHPGQNRGEARKRKLGKGHVNLTKIGETIYTFCGNKGNASLT